MQKGFAGFLFAILFFSPLLTFADTVTPAFFAHRNGTAQTVTSGVGATFDATTLTFDNTDAFNLTTDEFIPKVAGQYILTAGVTCETGTVNSCAVNINKNGAGFCQNNAPFYTVSIAEVTVSCVVQANGSTDAFRLRVLNNGGTTLNGDSTKTFFSGSLLVPLGTTTNAIVDIPNLDFALGLFLFIIMMFGILWLFSKKRS